MTIYVVIFLTLAGLLLGYGIAWFVARSRTAILKERTTVREQELASSRATIDRQTAELRCLADAKAGLDATLASERRNAEEKLRLVAEASEELKAQFKVLAAAALESNNSNFLQLARATLQNYQTHAAGELAQKEQAVKNLVDPIAQSLTEMRQQIQALEQARSQAYGSLTAQVASLLDTQRVLQTETGNLVKALREPQARGRWGELQLRRVVEMAGMLDYCDFDEQKSVTNEDRRYRPDVVVKLPGGKNIVIDSKVPLTSYLAALECDDPTAHATWITDHARQLKQHIDNLAGKFYWAQFQPTPEFVVLFLPGEVFFRAALDGDAELIEYGVSRKVIVASPTTLIALLKAVAYGWNQNNLAEKAREISDAGRLLYERLCVMTRHFEDVGGRLGAAVDSYNRAVGSMQRSVFPVARKFVELDRSLAAEDLEDVQQVEKSTRQLDAPDWQDGDGDTGLLFPGEKAEGTEV
jgi:DNA recombination protein RmuC